MAHMGTEGSPFPTGFQRLLQGLGAVGRTVIFHKFTGLE